MNCIKREIPILVYGITVKLMIHSHREFLCHLDASRANLVTCTDEKQISSRRSLRGCTLHSYSALSRPFHMDTGPLTTGFQKRKIFALVFVCGPQPVVAQVFVLGHSWQCSKDSLWCLEQNLGWPCPRQLTYCCTVPLPNPRKM